VQTAINYPVALPYLEAYRRFGHQPEQFPNAKRRQGGILSLPIFAEITAQRRSHSCHRLAVAADGVGTGPIAGAL
jgi:dTDP-4-amino-4,6-dideoxygalactose transaminase